MASVSHEVKIKKDDIERFLASVVLDDLGQTFARLAFEFLLKRKELENQVQKTIDARKIGPGFTDCGPVQLRIDFLARSFVPYLSKVWMCTKRIGTTGTIEDLPTGVVGERNLLLPGKTWVAVYQNSNAAWLDLKGAFVAHSGRRYQPKGPFGRAKKLGRTGSA
jgi:hypothetical protein